MLMGMLVVAITIVVAVILFVRYLYKTADSRKIKSVIKKYSKAYEREVIFADGMGGYFFIDYLILLPGRILALNLHRGKVMFLVGRISSYGRRLKKITLENSRIRLRM